MFDFNRKQLYAISEACSYALRDGHLEYEDTRDCIRNFLPKLNAYLRLEDEVHDILVKLGTVKPKEPEYIDD